MKTILSILAVIAISLVSVSRPPSLDAPPSVEALQNSDEIVYVPLALANQPVTIFGVESFSYDSNDVVELIKQSGTRFVRVNPPSHSERPNAKPLFWSDVEAVKGVYDWSTASTTETELTNISGAGKEAILVIRRTPEWARLYSGYPCGPVKVSEISALANFMKAAVERYSAPPFNVRYFELWNEPDAAREDVKPDEIYGCWGEKTDPYYGGRHYADVLKQVYPKVKEANSQAKLLIGGLLLGCDPDNPPEGKDCSSSLFFEGILVGGGGPYFDIVSYHTYDYYGPAEKYQNSNWHSASNTTGPVIAAKTQFLLDLLDEYGVTGKQLFCTEIALICSGCETASETFQQTKARYVAQAFAVSIAKGVKGGIWYTLVDRWRFSGLTDYNKNPLPAFDAFQFARQELGNAYGGEDISKDNMMIYEISTSKGKVLVAWSQDGNNHTLQLGATPKAIYDLYGNSKNLTQNVQVSNEPVYIEP